MSIEIIASEEATANKFTSRKFLIIAVQAILIMLLPILYKILGISDSVLQTVLQCSSAIVAIYTGANVVDQKWSGRNDISK